MAELTPDAFVSPHLKILLCAALLTSALACSPAPVNDAGLPEQDAGFDAGFDAGRPKPDAGPMDAGFTQVSLDDWCALQATAMCLRDMRCYRLDPSLFEDCRFNALAQCDAFGLGRSVREGRQAYDAGAAADCINTYATGSCETPPAACSSIFLGQVPPDGGCTLSEECDPALGFCDLFSTTCPRRCKAYLPRLASCVDYREQCNPKSDACRRGDGGTHICLPYSENGESCSGYEDCRNNALCLNSKCIVYQAKRGEACGVTNGYPYCDTTSFCRQTPVSSGTPPPGTCEKRPGLGGACVGFQGCLSGFYCSSRLGTGTCLPLRGPGEACDDSNQCQDALYCAFGTAKCTTLPTDGGDCSSQGSSYECAAGYFCDFSAPSGQYVCSRSRALGETCRYGSDCLSQTCDTLVAADGGFEQRCVPPCSHVADGGL